MSVPGYVQRALAILEDKHSSYQSQQIARQILKNAGLAEQDVVRYLKQPQEPHIYLFYA